jgi:hypothetical protein
VALYVQPVRVYRVSCLLLQVGVLGLAGFMYILRGPFPLPEPGMLNMRTRWVMSSSGSEGEEHRNIGYRNKGDSDSSK